MRYHGFMKDFSTIQKLKIRTIHLLLMLFIHLVIMPHHAQASIIKEFLSDAYLAESAKDPAAYIELSKKLFESQKYAEALNFASKALKTTKQNENYLLQIKALELIGACYTKIDKADSAFYFLKLAYNKAFENRVLHKTPELIKRFAEYYETEGNNTEAIRLYRTSLNIFIQQKNIFATAETLNSLGNLLKNIGEYNKALDYYKKALQLRQLIGNDIKELESINNIGTVYLLWGQYDKAIASFNHCLKIAETNNLKKELSNTLNNIAVLFNMLGDNEKCKIYLKQSIRIDLELGDKDLLARDYNNLGVLYIMENKTDTAMKYLHKALNIHIELNQQFERIEVLANLSMLHKEKGNMTKAMEYMEQAIGLATKSGIIELIASLENNIGLLHLENHDYDKALTHFINAKNLSAQINYRRELANSYQNLATVLELKHDYISALSNYKEFVSMRDSLFSEDNKNAIHELERKYENEKKEKEIALLNKQKLEQQSLIEQQLHNRKILVTTFIAVMTFLSVLFILFYQRYRIKQKQILEKALAEQQKLQFVSVLEAEENERKRIAQDLHDSLGQILSTARLNLASMESRFEEDNNNESLVYKRSLLLVDNACKEVRNISHNIMPSSLIKLGLVPAIRDLAENVNVGNGLKVNLHMDDLNLKVNEKIGFALYRIMQEIFSNIIKHSKADNVSVNMKKEKSMLICLIEDNGVGFDVNAIKQSSGIGWKSILSRLEVVNGKISIDSDINKGTRVKISVPFME